MFLERLPFHILLAEKNFFKDDLVIWYPAQQVTFPLYGSITTLLIILNAFRIDLFNITHFDWPWVGRICFQFGTGYTLVVSTGILFTVHKMVCALTFVACLAQRENR